MKELHTLNANILLTRNELIKLINKKGARNAVRRVFFQSRLNSLLKKREELKGVLA